MQRWPRRIRGAIGMGVTWAAAWAVAGLLIGVTSILLPGLPWDVFFSVFDAPLPALAVPGFVGGTIFALVLGIAGRRRRFDDLSLPAFTAWGALGGLLLGLVPTLLVASGAATATRVWQVALVLDVPFVLLSAASAAGSLALARIAERRALPAPDPARIGEG